MAGTHERDLSQLGMANHESHVISQEMLSFLCHSPQWYFSRGEIEDHSPSRKDGIDLKTEKQLRASYCSFLQELGVKLKVPQVTIATAMMLCHRFYMRQSHAKNEYKFITSLNQLDKTLQDFTHHLIYKLLTLATVSMFLACKVEETPRLLKDVAVKAYEIMYRRDPAAAQRINHKDVYQKQKELISNGERFLLATVAFDLNIQHPYKPLVAALKRLKIPHNDLAKVAWNFVNDWLQTTLCLQYKPHYIAAGSLYLAAKFLNIKLPSDRGKAWWLEFDVSPHQLEEVVRQMIGLLGHDRRLAMPSSPAKARQDMGEVKKASSDDQASTVTSSEVASDSTPPGTEEKSREGRESSKPNDAYISGSQTLPREDTCDCAARRSETPQFQTSDSGSPHSIVEDGNRCDEGEVQVTTTVASNELTGCKIVSDYCTGLGQIDKDRIKEALKKRRYDKLANKQAAVTLVNCRDDDDSWIVRELECGVELAYACEEKRQRIC